MTLPTCIFLNLMLVHQQIINYNFIALYNPVYIPRLICFNISVLKSSPEAKWSHPT